MTPTEKISAEFDEMFPNLGATDPKEGWYDAKPEVKAFIATIAQAEQYAIKRYQEIIQEELEQELTKAKEKARQETLFLLRREIENECNSELVYAGKTLADSGEMGFLNVLILRLKGNILSSLDKLTDKE